MLKIFKNKEGKDLAVNTRYIRMVMPSPFNDENCLLYIEGNGNHTVIPCSFDEFVSFINDDSRSRIGG